MKNIAVIGSGTMGNGIAHTFAQFGYSVSMVDINEESLIKGLSIISKNLDRQVSKGSISEEVKVSTLKNIQTFTDLKLAVQNADLVVEAATENVNVKLKIFSDLDTFCPAECILASNTSSISITEIASATKREKLVIGMHFMNPVPVMPLVEIINGYSTSDETTSIIIDIAGKLSKTPVIVNDYPGFIANRILMPMINEAIYALYENVAGVSEIDTIMKMGMAHPMGPLQLADYIGLDVCLSIMRILYNGLGNQKYAPCPLLINMVASKQLGIKSGVGFYKYEAGKKELVVADKFAK